MTLELYLTYFSLISLYLLICTFKSPVTALFFWLLSYQVYSFKLTDEIELTSKKSPKYNCDPKTKFVHHYKKERMEISLLPMIPIIAVIASYHGTAIIKFVASRTNPDLVSAFISDLG